MAINLLKKDIIRQLSDNITLLQDVSNFEKVGFKGFPAASVICSGNESEYWTNAENKRSYSFLIRLYVNIGREIEGSAFDSAKEEGEQLLADLVDQVLDTFDNYYKVGNDALYMLATPSAWGYAQLGEGWVRTAEIRLQIVTHYRVA